MRCSVGRARPSSPSHRLSQFTSQALVYYRLCYRHFISGSCTQIHLVGAYIMEGSWEDSGDKKERGFVKLRFKREGMVAVMGRLNFFRGRFRFFSVASIFHRLRRFFVFRISPGSFCRLQFPHGRFRFFPVTPSGDEQTSRRARRPPAKRLGDGYRRGTQVFAMFDSRIFCVFDAKRQRIWTEPWNVPVRKIFGRNSSYKLFDKRMFPQLRRVTYGLTLWSVVHEFSEGFAPPVRTTQGRTWAMRQIWAVLRTSRTRWIILLINAAYSLGDWLPSKWKKTRKKVLETQWSIWPWAPQVTFFQTALTFARILKNVDHGRIVESLFDELLARAYCVRWILICCHSWIFIRRWYFYKIYIL